MPQVRTSPNGIKKDDKFLEARDGILWERKCFCIRTNGVAYVHGVGPVSFEDAFPMSQLEQATRRAVVNAREEIARLQNEIDDLKRDIANANNGKPRIISW